MSEAVLDDAIEQIADGLSVDWNAIDKAAASRERDWAKSLRVLNDIVKLHREAAVDYEQTTLAAPGRAASSQSAPDTWGKYRLANKVGEGSYGSVYRAWDSELERDVALKILHRRVGDTRLKERLLHEGRALAKIRHNNVVSVLGVEAHADRVGLCMEFVRGKTLAELVRDQGRMSAAEAVLVGEDLCRALSAVHRAGYIHRDVKAKNVMRDDTGRIVLMDFGTGRTAEAQEGKSDRAGTPLYMAPEVLEGGPASARSDVYSLGVLLYHLVTGEYPVTARSVEELRDAHGRREHRWLSELRPDLPVGFMQVVEKAIALDPDERYANASELLAALGPLKTGSSPVVMHFVRWGTVLAVVASGMLALGAMTSAVFNIALQRSEFASESYWDYLIWGRRTSFMPFMTLLVVLLGATLLAVLRRLLLAMSSHVRTLDDAIRKLAGTTAHRLRLDEVSVLASCSLLLSAVVVGAAWWYFSPLLLAFITYASTGPVETLSRLSPDAVGDHNRYRQVLSVVVILTVVVWYPVVRVMRRGQAVHWGFIAGGVVSTCVAVALLNFPYRMLYFNKSFEAVTWRNNHCYAIGERGDDVLLFCPELSPPRNRVVKRSDSDLTPLGVKESIFSRY
jgi:RIO-like serine/threonine protein kinase